MKTLTKTWFKAALIRAIRTFAQTAVSMIAVGAAMSEVDWKTVFSVSAVAAIASILTSVATGLPEAEDDGTLVIDDNNPDSDLYTLQLNDDPAKWAQKQAITLKVAHTSATEIDTEN